MNEIMFDVDTQRLLFGTLLNNVIGYYIFFFTINLLKYVINAWKGVSYGFCNYQFNKNLSNKYGLLILRT